MTLRTSVSIVHCYFPTLHTSLPYKCSLCLVVVVVVIVLVIYPFPLAGQSIPAPRHGPLSRPLRGKRNYRPATNRRDPSLCEGRHVGGQSLTFTRAGYFRHRIWDPQLNTCPFIRTYIRDSPPTTPKSAFSALRPVARSVIQSLYIIQLRPSFELFLE